MKLAIMSDSHDNWATLEQAVALANEKGCEVLLFAGDLIAPPGVAILEKFKGKVKFVWGNNEMERVGITRQMDASANIEMAGDYFEGELNGIRVFMCHSPKFGENAAKTGNYDLVIYGHTHEYQEEKVGNTLLLNPGAIQGKLGTATFAIFDTQIKQIEKITLD